MRTVISALLTVSLGVCTFAQRASEPIDEWKALDWSLSQRSMKTLHPQNGFVPDEITAIRIGEAIAIAQWGEKQISEERPFKARLRAGIWTVKGTLHPTGIPGGTAVVQLSKATGAVLFAVHQQ